MQYNKIETTSNFVFSPALARGISLKDHGSDVWRLRLSAERWPRGSDSFATLSPEEFAASPSTGRLEVGQGGELALNLGGVALIQSEPGRGFGVCGTKWLFALRYDASLRFYGMGQKNLGFELSGKRSKFWNTDVFADFHWDQIERASTDPMYASFPVLIIKSHGRWMAIIVDNPHAVFMNTGADEQIFQPGAGPFIRELYFGSTDGAPDVWLLAADKPWQLIRKVQTLLGRVPLPPLWALGHQQCRWGYRSHADLVRVADEYRTRGIPNDGLWLDIDYMDGFRVFTVDKRHFSDPEEQLAELRARGHRVVPILDPGLRKDPEYEVYARARQRNVLCKTIEGQEFTGFVWPGYTVFPDFSLPDGRQFWADQVADFSRRGFGGYWIDMNDPSTGSAPLEDMRFSHGHLDHGTWHNQYALGMAVATRQGLLAARPDERPFVISRSAFLSQGRHSAMWNGDNMSNPHHMKNSIAMALNLSLSGMPFNGPDVPGFALEASDQLMIAWYKLGCLFPFLRNHNLAGQSDQEPWTRGEAVCAIVGDYIRLRYRLLPYLYSLFRLQEEKGDPMLRPLWFHDEDPQFEKTDDAFLVGPALLQAPFVDPEARLRQLVLPHHAGGEWWYDPESDGFQRAGTRLSFQNRPETTPLLLAAPACLPLQRGERTSNGNDLYCLDLLVVLRDGMTVCAAYVADDGISFAYRQGVCSRLEISASLRDGRLQATVRQTESSAGPISWRWLVLADGPVREIECNGKRQATVRETLRLAGRPVSVHASQEMKA